MVKLKIYETELSKHFLLMAFQPWLYKMQGQESNVNQW